MIPYKLIYSKRKTLSMSVSKDLELIVRAPNRTSKKYIEKFILDNSSWIDAQINKINEVNKNRIVLSENDIETLKNKAKSYIPTRVSYFENIMNLQCTGVKITSATKRWGSCSYKNSLCFSYKIMLLEQELIDYVIVHELSHILEKNHGTNFYKVIEKYMPDYKQRIVKIKQIGRII